MTTEKEVRRRIYDPLFFFKNFNPAFPKLCIVDALGRRQKAGKKVSKINAEKAMNAVDVSKMLPHLGCYVMQISTTVSLND
jgi:hypothetical protein